ncbi:hypothetical protein [Yoonia sp. SDW83-1]|uniref:hypothetical protein n=1 Tax=Yoonia sp. SDW83-1 TaxID=3366945 RepID=UPI00398C3DB8
MSSSTITVGNIISSLLPHGSQEPPLVPPDECSALERCKFVPMFPTDVFAVSAYLCKVGGVVSYFDPSPYAEETDKCYFTIGIDFRKQADDAAAEWRDTDREDLGQPPKFVEDLWEILIESWDHLAMPGSYVIPGNRAPDWWRAALLLAMISDMACNRILRDPLSDFKPSPFERWVAKHYITQAIEENAQEKQNKDNDAASGTKGIRPPPSLCQVVDSGIVCVLPKVRVAPVGATLRNISRNLSLLPGRGEVRCSWHMSPAQPPNEDTETLDVLLIPEPSEIHARCFDANGDEEISLKERHYYKRDWETFHLNQDWINTDEGKKVFVRNCRDLLANAKKESGCINGVVLPEYAICFELFEELCGELKKEEKRLEFVIAGSSDNCEDDGNGNTERGNHVLTRVWYTEEAHQTTSRKKHHRWRMDRSQVETYALSAALNPKIKNWWEDTPLGRREVHFHRFRERSVFSVLICEELARSDPCHEILRSVAPNLIFALLLDGPQIKQRWPAQYAANLADDPGSSVLTFTSFGLIDRSNKQGHHPENHSIALWKDDSGKFVEIEMPKGEGPRAVLLSLWSDHVSDRTITGKNSRVRSWRYSSHFPIYGNKNN